MSSISLDDIVPPIQECNILYIGKSLVGKTAHIQTLIDPSKTTSKNIKNAQYSKEAHYGSFVLINEEKKTEYALKIIDTPGLLYSGCDENALLQQCWKLLEKSIRHLNAIILVYRFDTITEEDIHMIDIVKKFFGSHFRKNTVVIFTHVEKIAHKPDFLNEQLNSLNQTIKKSLKEFCDDRILFFGAVIEDEIKRMTSESATRLYSNVNIMRHQFFEKILTLPPTPLPDELILMYDSKIEEMLNSFTKSYDQDNKVLLENIKLQLIEKKRKMALKENSFYKKRQDVNTIESWNIQDELEALQNAFPKQVYKVHNAIQKNILLVGASGSGKTTFIKVMQDPSFSVRQGITFSVSRFTKYYPLYLVVDNQHLIINFIDTPGFGDIAKGKLNDEESRKNARMDILSAIQTCLTESVTEIHALFYFHQNVEEKNWTKYDDIFFQEYQNVFPEIFKKCAWLMISKCEGLVTDLEEKLEEIKNNTIQRVSKAKEIDSRIAFTGAIDADAMENYKPEIQSEYKESIEKLRKKLFQTIYSLSDALPLPASIQAFQKDIEQDLENEKKKAAEEKLKRSLFPKPNAKVNLVSHKGEYVICKEGYLAFGKKNQACKFLVEYKGECITLTCDGKAVHRSSIDGWVGLYSKPLSLKICPESNSILFTLLSLEDGLHIGYSTKYEGLYLQIDNGKIQTKFRWEFL